MKILKLRFKNLNSLKGEWQIDFRHPAYANEGIFAITGSTGAGKSTILDAICLALYGITPRLKDISQSQNDIMSRQTGECFAEVVFTTNSNSYTAFWSQKRAYVKAEGKLQSPKHELSYYINDHEKGTLIEEKAQRTKAKIEEITGMDFHRFTRAMLLAQGSFSAFLQADADDRSPILEQITGTEIYTDISKKVHELHRQAELELKSLTDKLSGIQLLSDDEERQLTEQKSALLTDIQQQKTDIDNTEKDRIWRQNLAYYTQQVAELSQQQTQLSTQVEQFAPKKQQLQRALKALQVTGDVNQANFLQHQLTQQQAESEQFNQQLPIINNNCEVEKNNLFSLQNKMQASETAWQTAEPLFHQVRELDTTIFQQQNQLQDVNDNLQQIQTQLEQKKQDLTAQRTVLQGILQQQTHKKNLQQQIPKADSLPQTLATLRQLQENSQELQKQQQTLSQEQANLQQIQQQLTQQNQTFNEKLQQLNAQLQQQQHAKQQLDQQINDALNGQNFANLRQQAEQFWQVKNLLELLKNSIGEWQYNTDIYTQNTIKFDNITAELTALQTTWQHEKLQQQHAEEKVNLLNHNSLLLAKIKDLSQERHRLVDGEPCPLCGATSHPFASDTPNPSDETEQALAIAKQQLANHNEQLQKLSLDKNDWQNQQQFLNEQQQNIRQKNNILIEQMQANINQLNNFNINLHWQNLQQNFVNLSHVYQQKSDKNWQNFIPQLQDFLQLLDNYLLNLNNELNNLQQRLNSVENLQQQQQHNQQMLANLSETYNQQQHQQALRQSEQQYNQARLHEIEQQFANFANRQQQLQQRVDDLTQDFYPSVQMFVPIEKRLDDLQNFHQQYQQLEKEIDDFSHPISESQKRIATLLADEQNLINNQQQAQQKQKQLNQKLQALQQNRQQLFGNKNVQAEAEQLLQQKQQDFDAWRQGEKTVNDLTNHLHILQKQMDGLTLLIEQLTTQKSELDDKIQQKFNQLKFSNLADYQSACLTDDEREDLQNQANTLNEQQQRLDTLLSQAKNEQQLLLNQPRTELTLTVLLENLEKLKQNLSKNEQKLGSVEQMLNTNQQVKQSQTNLIAQIEQKNQNAKEWQYLHKLIGSSDGKKFRNFAQGLTFNMMINHANQQLQKMSDRYLLIADSEQPLMLNVIDNYQGGQVRTSKNLSGGESFIISLALALGLSNMASHRMRVDSLFLDEGFGTLDEEALDVALDTLSTLQQSGKLIGVISHISALKERISSKIVVTPKTGGVSKIDGAGVEKLG